MNTIFSPKTKPQQSPPLTLDSVRARVGTINPDSPLSDLEVGSFIEFAQTTCSPEQKSQLFSQILGQWIFSLLLKGEPLSDAYRWATLAGFPSSYVDDLTDFVRSNCFQPQTKVQPQPQVQPQTKVHPQPQVQPRAIAPSSTLKQELLSKPPEADEKEKEAGLLMEESYGHHSMQGVKFLPPCVPSIRHTVFRFRKPPQVSFNALSRCLSEVLSHAGFDPEIEPIFRSLPGNQFELHVLRPRDQWISAGLFSYVGGKDVEEVIEMGRKAHLPDEQIRLNSLNLISSKIKSLSTSKTEIEVPFAVDLDGAVFNLNLTTGAILIGKPKSGKSTAIKTTLVSLALAFSPRQVQFALFDFKEGLTLSFFDGLPHAWENMASSESIDECLSVLKALQAEHQSRAAKFRGKYENVFDYNNSVNDSEKLPFIFVVIEEVAAAKRKAVSGQVESKFLELLFEGVSQWRGTGIAFILTSQYGKAETGLTPEVRSSIGSKVSFSASANAVSLIFDSSNWIKMAERLSGGGDCIVSTDGGYTHCQGFDMSTDLVKKINPLLCQMHQAQPPKFQPSATTRDLW